MKSRLFALSLFGTGWLLSPPFLHAAPAVVTSVDFPSVLVGDTTTLTAHVADPDGDLDFVRFQAAGPGFAGWHTLGDVEVNGAQATATFAWTPSLSGRFSIRATVYDLSGVTGAERTMAVFVNRVTVTPRTIAPGQSYMASGGEILTADSTGSSVVVQPGGNAIFWASGRAILRPGFRAEPGSFFWATVDSDSDGYSDEEEYSDADGDGLFDAYEIDHGLNMYNAADANWDSDGDGLSNLAEFRVGRDPFDARDGTVPSGGYHLVLKTPGNEFFGVKLPSGQLTPVGGP